MNGSSGVSDGDSFLQEVSEEVRRDRMIAMLRRNAPWIAAGVVAIVGAASVNAWLSSQSLTSAREKGDAVWATLNTEDPAERIAALQGMDTQDPLVELQLATALLADGQRAQAVSSLERVVANGAVDPALRDIARLKIATLAGSDMTPASRLDILDRLAAEGHVLRPLALEQRALVALSQGDIDAARADLDTIANDPSPIYPGLAERVEQVLTALQSRDRQTADE